MSKGRMFIAAASVAAAAAQAASISCRVEPDYSVREAGKAGQAFVKITLAAERIAQSKRPPVNLAIVLDRSGSMSGDRIARARDAAIEAIDRLDERDVVSVVVYDDVVETIIPAQHVTGKEAMKEKVRAIEVRGSTALFAGVSAGAEQLKKFQGQCEISRVLLLSDGQANVGPSSADELGRYGASLMKEGIAVSTVGLGAYYNEDLMTRLAQKSDGNSYFVENNADLPAIFARELGDVLSVSATQVALKAQFGEGFVPVELIGRDGRISGSTVTLDLNQLYGGQEKFVIVRCDAAPGKAGDTREVARASVSYADPVNGARREVSAVGSVTFSSDVAAVRASVNKDVVRHRIVTENAVRTERAIQAADKGDFAAAKSIIMENVKAADDFAEEFNDASMKKEAEYQRSSAAPSLAKEKFSARARKAQKTRSFQIMNQQIMEDGGSR